MHSLRILAFAPLLASLATAQGFNGITLHYSETATAEDPSCTSSEWSIYAALPTPADKALYSAMTRFESIAGPTDDYCSAITAIPSSLHVAYSSYQTQLAEWFSTMLPELQAVESNCPLEAYDMSMLGATATICGLAGFPTGDSNTGGDNSATTGGSGPTATTGTGGPSSTNSAAGPRETGLISGAMLAAGVLGAAIAL